MKLKTKFQDEDFALGEVVDANVYYGGSERIKMVAETAKGGAHTFYFRTLKELNGMFEDYEGPKGFWFIEWNGDIFQLDINAEAAGRMREFGNYFSSREEAEKAVKKLKALANLRRKGLKFTYVGEGIVHFELPRLVEIIDDDESLGVRDTYSKEDWDSLRLLFGGEE